MIQAGNIGNTAVAISPSDTAANWVSFMCLYVGGTGDVTIVTNGGTTTTFKTVPVGFFYVAGQGVKNTGTTATNIVAIS